MGNTLEQKRAKHALNKINSLRNFDQTVQGEYKSYVSSLPATIVMNGLGQAIVMLDAKKDPAHTQLSFHLTDWISTQVPELQGAGSRFIETIMKKDQSVYVAAQREAMAYLTWLKQFARAYLAEGE